MDISENNKSYLSFMKDIYDVSSELSIRTYIWGGFTTDIFEEKFLRDHGDLDCFVENMMTVLEQLIIKYKDKGYQTKFYSDINMLEIRKGNQHADFNPLDIDGEVAMWRHIGDHGTVYFPYDWLDSTPRNFYGVNVYTSGLCFEYGFRKIAGDVNPEWKEREKDSIAKDYLEERIREKYIDDKDILKCIWSYNPFWIKKGYDPFTKPTLVFPEIIE